MTDEQLAAFAISVLKDQRDRHMLYVDDSSGTESVVIDGDVDVLALVQEIRRVVLADEKLKAL